MDAEKAGGPGTVRSHQRGGLLAEPVFVAIDQQPPARGDDLVAPHAPDRQRVEFDAWGEFSGDDRAEFGQSVVGDAGQYLQGESGQATSRR
ncbi:hypothetical protein L3Q67_45380 (plasmid) [Saccharothrix sp. AJ9571]|nr:hypothetical protein L3Q67_45380 [Saccharothrix sp. AJ9571]